jgi:hypothetical protein
MTQIGSLHATVAGVAVVRIRPAWYLGGLASVFFSSLNFLLQI